MSDMKASKAQLLKHEVAGHMIRVDEEAPKVLLIGQPGAGKTHSIATLLQAGLEVFVLFTEQGKDSLLEAVLTMDLTEEQRANLHWSFVGASTPGFKGLLQFAKDVNMKGQSDLQKDGAGSVPKSHQQLIDVIRKCSNFIDQNGEEFGDASTWANDRVLVVDGLSGINDMAMDLVVGAKVIKSMADWGMAMDTEIKLIKQFVNDLTCGFVLLAHLEINKDEVDQKIYKFPRLLGNKNSYDFGKYFSDVILAKDLGSEYVWSTEENQMQLKTRNLEKKKKLPPSFVPLFTKWASRLEALIK